LAAVANSSLPTEPASWPPTQTRRLGASILVASLLGAGGLYWSETCDAETPAGEFLVGYDRQRDHDMGVMYGRGGRDLMNALEALESPAGHFVLMVGAGAIGAGICFHRARLVEDEASPKL
jgi:hypothetical protein